MKKVYMIIFFWGLSISTIMSQDSYLSPADGYKSNDILSSFNNFLAFDIHENMLYANNGDTIKCFNINTGELLMEYPRPTGYESYASFITMSGDGNYIWAGYTTSGNTDDRIYRIDSETGIWELMAIMPANFDLEFLNDHILVSGLNTTSWDDPAAVFVLDTSGNNKHRKIIETGGSPAGLSINSNNDLVYATSFFAQQNGLFSWDSTDVAAVLDNIADDSLTLTDATKLSGLPAGAYDCHVDASDHVIFNINDFSAHKVLAKWNGTIGNENNYDTLALATSENDWLSFIKSRGSISVQKTGNAVYALSFGQPIAELHLDYLPVLAKRFKNPEDYETAPDKIIDLASYFINPDDPVASFSYEILVNSDSSVAIASIEEQMLSIDYIASGQTNIVLKAESAGQFVQANFVVGVYPEISGDYEITGFGELNIQYNSFWNGSDLSGGFNSGNYFFPNHFNPEYLSWSKWAYSNKANDTLQNYLNQFSAITASGFDTTGTENNIYATSYIPVDWVTSATIPVPLYINDTVPREIKGLFVTNSAWTALTMENGDDFAKQFGGETGNDPDWFKLQVWGYLEGAETDTIEFYLADYRFNDNTKDYIIKTWQWLDISEIGKTDSLHFNLASSDMGLYGMNTPSYFCADNIYMSEGSSAIGENQAAGINYRIYPNPTSGIFSIYYYGDQETSVSVYNIYGRLVFSDEDYKPESLIDLNKYPDGPYIVKVQQGSLITGRTIIIQ